MIAKRPEARGQLLGIAAAVAATPLLGGTVVLLGVLVAVAVLGTSARLATVLVEIFTPPADGVLVLDLNMRGESGLDAIPRLRDPAPKIRAQETAGSLRSE